MRYTNGFAVSWLQDSETIGREYTFNEAASKSEKSLVVGLDVGTSKIVAIVGESQADGTVEVIGLGSHPSKGSQGVVVDMTSTEQAIQRAVEEAELMAGL